MFKLRKDWLYAGTRGNNSFILRLSQSPSYSFQIGTAPFIWGGLEFV